MFRNVYSILWIDNYVKFLNPEVTRVPSLSDQNYENVLSDLDRPSRNKSCYVIGYNRWKLYIKRDKQFTFIIRKLPIINVNCLFITNENRQCSSPKFNIHFLSNMVICGRIWLDYKICLFIAHHFLQSDLTGSKRVWPEMDINRRFEKSSKIHRKLKIVTVSFNFENIASITSPYHDQNGKQT